MLIPASKGGKMAGAGVNLCRIADAAKQTRPSFVSFLIDVLL
jgi:hypothetical protein